MYLISILRHDRALGLQIGSLAARRNSHQDFLYKLMQCIVRSKIFTDQAIYLLLRSFGLGREVNYQSAAGTMDKPRL
jgi:hypothetical protein